MTSKKPIVLDTDMISSFAWVKRVDIIIKLYSPEIILLDVVETELSRVPHLLTQVREYIKSRDIDYIKMDIYSKEGKEYARLTSEIWSVGDGEAAGMAYCRYNDCILGSNNFRDILNYCKKYNIKIKTTVDIMLEAFENNIIDKNEGDRIWKRMLSKRRKLPYKTFSGALKEKGLGE
ncbi:hypothetical protein KAW48_06000 [candidate division WOR-3 bacterium]|nr:hypothetical protein [candidate division WOR-3 bacterium]